METNRISALRNVVNAEPRRGAGPGDGSATTTPPIDLAFLATQTFGDAALEHQVLTLFVEQARRVVPSLPALAPREQGDAAHLLKGSARGIGAWPAAVMAEAYEMAAPADRPPLHAALATTFAALETAIETRLGVNPQGANA